MQSALLTNPFPVLLWWDSTPQSQSVHLCLDWRSSISFHIPYPPFWPSSAWIWPSSFSFCASPTPSLYTALPIWCSSIPGSCSHFLSECIILPFIPTLRFAAGYHLMTPLLNITNRAKWHWNSISSPPQEQIISRYKERLQLLCTVDELSVPAFVGPDVNGERVDDSDMMFDWYHSIAWSGYCVGVPAFVFESLAFFFDFLNVVRQQIQCSRRWQLVWFRSDNEQ